MQFLKVPLALQDWPYVHRQLDLRIFVATDATRETLRSTKQKITIAVFTCPEGRPSAQTTHAGKPLAVKVPNAAGRKWPAGAGADWGIDNCHQWVQSSLLLMTTVTALQFRFCKPCPGCEDIIIKNVFRHLNSEQQMEFISLNEGPQSILKCRSCLEAQGSLTSIFLASSGHCGDGGRLPTLHCDFQH